MKRRRLGRSGLVVSEIGMGTMTFGSMADEETSLAILDRAFDAGVDWIDAAEVYPVPPDPKGAGATEEICGRWLKTKPRDAVVVATKVAGPGGGWFQAPVRSGRTGLDRHHIERAVEGSLRRLGVETLDLYQTHWPDADLPLDETLEALDRLVEAGKVRAIGCSNEGAAGVVESLWRAEALASARYETIQNNYSLLNRRFEDELAAVCRRHRLSLLAYSPLGAGVLAGKYAGGAWPEGARFTRYRDHSPRTQMMTRRFVNERTLAATDRFAAVAAEHGLSLPTLALAFVLAQDFVGSAIVGATRVEQLEPLLAASEVRLDPALLAACDEISREIRYPLG